MATTTGRPRETVGETTDSSALSWVKSTFSLGNGDCLEFARLPVDHVAVRDSKDKAGPVLRFTSGEWRSFLSRVKCGELGSPDN